MDDAGTETASLAQNRSRRSRVDKTGRLAALDRLKKAKSAGEKLKYEVDEVHNVYDEVDEGEYSKIVQTRQEEEWIIDDDGCGYVEDGRDFFDDEPGGDDVDSATAKGKRQSQQKKSKNPNIRAPGSKAKNIKSMFAAAAVNCKKKPEKDVTLNDDDLLGDIMSELHQDAVLKPSSMSVRRRTPKAPIVNPFSVRSSQKKAVTSRVPPPSLRKAPIPYQGEEEKSMPPKRASQTNGTRKTNSLERNVCAKGIDIEEFGNEEATSDRDDITPDDDIVDDVDMTAETKNVADAFEDGNDMDVSGINFDEDFSEQQAVQKNGENGNTNLLEESTLGMSWETVKAEPMNLPRDVQVDSSKLPLTTNEEGEQVLRMYWFDAYEDYFNQPGVVYLFGKVWIESASSYVSCCLKVRNIERKLFLLPRKTRMNLSLTEDTGKTVTFVDVYKEFNDVIAEKYKIMTFKSMKVTKSYCFEKAEVPSWAEYLEVRYSAEYTQLPSNLKGETFSHVFGANTSCLEMLLLERKMKGPGWIDVKLPQLPSPAVSWCKVEAFVSKPDHVTISQSSASPPPLVVMTMNTRTVSNARTHQNEVVAVGCLIQHEFQVDKPAPKVPFQEHFCAISKPSDCVFPFDFKEQIQKQNGSMKVDVTGSERGLLSFLLAKIHKTDPDLIVGHDLLGFDLEVLLHRINQNKVPHWSRLGRLKRANMPRLSNATGFKGGSVSSAACGRLVCDVKISAKELIRCRSYDLTELVNHVLKGKRQVIDAEEIRSRFNQSQDLLQLIEWTLMDASYVLRIMYDLNVLPLALQITNICGNVMARTLLGGRSERNEYLLLHAFTERDFIVPDKFYNRRNIQVAHDDDELDQTAGQSKKTGRRKPAYSGGLVLEPKRGFYDKFILLLDFNSLYPSIIQEYNICFTTMSREVKKDVNKTQEAEEDVADLRLPDPDLEPGILPTEIRKLVQSRRQVKQLMKMPDVSNDLYTQYDIRQKALKLTANSMYGCLGFVHSRFHAKCLAALVTGKGREILLQTKDLVQNMNLEVIYGDTDSIMINTNSTDIEQVFRLGNKVKTEVNKLYRLLEIDIDGVYKSMLLLKKKKYAALAMTKVGDKYTTHQELKGLDIVRRDWCQLAKEAGNFVVSEILSGELRETVLENIHSKLLEVGQQVKEGSLPVELYLITKSLTKNPTDYPDKKSLPHVTVAMRLNSKGGKQLQAGDAVYYVICEDGSNLPASQRAYHPDELSKRTDLKIDTQYYLAHQLHPVVSRLCDVIDGTDAARIAECLGLDAAGYRQSAERREEEDEKALLGARLSEEERYKDCDRLHFPCPQCGRDIIFDNISSQLGVELSMEKCPNKDCGCSLDDYTNQMKNKLSTVIRKHVQTYYQGWMKCDDSVCGVRTRRLPLTFSRGHPVCPVCRHGLLQQESTDSDLYNQLCFYRHVFDKCVDLGVLKHHVDRWLKRSAYSVVDLDRLFDGLFVMK